MGMILRIASSRIVGQGDIVGRSGYFSLNLSANSVMRGRLDARRTLKSLVADLRVLRTTSLMGNATARFFNEKGPDALKGTSVYKEELQQERCIVFSGNATEAINVFPTKVNVSVAASLASVGPDNMQVSIQSTPGFTGDTQKVEIKNEQVHAVVEVYSATSEIAGWSVVNTLLNITSPIVF